MSKNGLNKSSTASMKVWFTVLDIINTLSIEILCYFNFLQLSSMLTAVKWINIAMEYIILKL